MEPYGSQGSQEPWVSNWKAKALQPRNAWKDPCPRWALQALLSPTIRIGESLLRLRIPRFRRTKLFFAQNVRPYWKCMDGHFSRGRRFPARSPTGRALGALSGFNGWNSFRVFFILEETCFSRHKSLGSLFLRLLRPIFKSIVGAILRNF